MKDIKELIRNDPFGKLLGITVGKIEPGYAEISLVLTENMLNFMGAPHGGVIMSLADVAFSAISNQEHFPSVALNVNCSFTSAAKVGDNLVAHAKAASATKRTANYLIEIKANNNLVAIFNGLVYRKKK